MSAINHTTFKSYAENPLLNSDDFKQIKTLGKELYQFWGHTTLTRLCSKNVTHFDQVIKKIKDQIVKIGTVYQKQRQQSTEDSAAWDKFIEASSKFVIAAQSGSKSVRLWSEAHVSIFTELQKKPAFEAFSSNFLDLEKHFEYQRQTEDLTEKVKIGYKRISIASDLALKSRPEERKNFITLIIASLFPSYANYVENRERYVTEFETLDPNSKKWKAQIYAANEFGRLFDNPKFGHELEEIFLKTVNDKTFPIARNLFQKTPVIELEIPVAKEEPLPTPAVKPPSPQTLAPPRKEEPLPPLHPTLEALCQGFKQIPTHQRVERWNKANFETPPDPTIFPNYTDETWKKAIARHRIPFYLLLNLQDQLETYGSLEKGSWRFVVTLELPSQLPIQGYAEVSKRDGMIYHCYFQANKENVSLAMNRLQKLEPVDTFYTKSFKTVVNDFHLEIDENQVISIEDTRCGIKASILPLFS